MRPLLLILLIAWASTGCIPRRNPSGGEPRTLRVALPEAWVEDVRRTSVALAPLEGLLRSERTAWTAEGNWCVRFRVRRAHWPDGTLFTAADLVDIWEERLREGAGPQSWLFASLTGRRDFQDGGARHVAGLAVAKDAGGLEVCFDADVPDWAARLDHPALWPWRSTPGTAMLTGPGPYTQHGAVLHANPFFEQRASLDRVELVIDPAAPASAWADVALVVGQGPPEATETQAARAPGWDIVYALWLEPTGSWLADPAFRHWLAETIDRESMVRLLFDGAGEVAYRLIDTATRPTEPATAPRPFSGRSKPRMALVYDAGDGAAQQIASRVSAVLGSHGVDVQLEAVPAVELAERLRDNRVEIAVVTQRPAVSDPVLALQETLWSLGAEPALAWLALERAATLDTPADRSRAAASVETGLLEEVRLVPLVRLHAWLSTAPDVRGVEPGLAGVLRFERARWAD